MTKANTTTATTTATKVGEQNYTASKLIVAIDTANVRKACSDIESMLSFTSTFKLGNIAYSSLDFWAIVRFLKECKKDIFLDLKLWDIPATVERTIYQLGSTGNFKYMTLRWNSLKMDTILKIREEGFTNPVAVVSLTSNKDRSDGNKEWTKFASELYYNGFYWSICSPEFLSGSGGVKKIVPGIRLPDQSPNDHVMTLTPAEAIKLGAEKIVIGSAVFDSLNPKEQMLKVWQSVDSTIHAPETK